MLTRLTPIPVAIALAIASAGCGNSISADTSCNDFLHASLPAQDEAVSNIAADVHAGNAVTPLGRPNVNYLCANNPEMSVGDAIRHTG